jgi:hypothetical protein
VIALLSTATFAASPPPGDTPPTSSVGVALRGTTEAWSDPAIAQVYRSGAWFGGLGVVVRMGGWFALDAEANFRRLKGEGSELTLAPMSLLAEARRPFGVVEAFVGLGPTWTAFTEGGETGPVVTGARLAGELRTGLRIDTGLVDPPMAPANGGPVRAVELEIMIGRRAELPGGDGFSLGAWRGGVGLLARF